MDLKTKYSWAKQENGNYSIFDLPIFKAFSDSDKGEVTEKDAREIVENFQEDIEKNGYYPRIHLEHQNGDGSRPGAGFIDNLRFNNGVFYADLVEIPESVFSQLKEPYLKFPYRSVEYHQTKKKILSLALLESQPSFFQFPILALQDSGVEMNQEQKVNFSMRQGKIMKFSACTKDKKFCGECEKNKTCKEKMTLDEEKDEEKKDKDEEENEVSRMQADDTGGEESPEPVEEEGPGHEEEEFDKLDILVENTNKILSFLRMLLGEEEGGTPGEGDATQPEPQDLGQKPPVAMQMFEEMQERITRLEQKNSSGKSMARLKAICEANPTINFSQESKTVKKFSSESDRDVYLNSLEARPVYQKHSATSFLDGIKTKEISKFSQGNPELAKEVKLAIQDYKDTISQDNQNEAKKFQALWPDINKWIEYRVDQKRVEMGIF